MIVAGTLLLTLVSLLFCDHRNHLFHFSDEYFEEEKPRKQTNKQKLSNLIHKHMKTFPHNFRVTVFRAFP